MSTYQLDVPELHRRLDARRQKRGLTWRQLAHITGLAPSTLSRISDGSRPDADALVTLLVWLDLDTDVAVMIKPKEQR